MPCVITHIEVRRQDAVLVCCRVADAPTVLIEHRCGWKERQHRIAVEHSEGSADFVRMLDTCGSCGSSSVRVCVEVAVVVLRPIVDI